MRAGVGFPARYRRVGFAGLLLERDADTEPLPTTVWCS